MERLRWGIVSTAGILGKVLPGMRAGARSEVVAIASRDLARAEQTARTYGIPRAYGSYEELFADPEVDAIYNPLPNHLHATWTLAAAQAGKHVLCEKPLAMDVAEAQRMIDGCRAAGVVLAEGFMYRQHPQWVRARELIAAGRLGEVHAVQSAFLYDNRDPEDIRNIAEFGGGGLMDIGCYCIDASRFLLDAEPTSVQGLVHLDPVFGTDVLASGLLGFDGDRQASFVCGTQSAPDQRVHVLGSEAQLTIEVPFNAPPDRPLRLLIADNRPQRPPEVIEVPPADQYGLQADAFAQAVLDGGPLPGPPENALANLAVIAAMRQGTL